MSQHPFKYTRTDKALLVFAFMFVVALLVHGCAMGKVNPRMKRDVQLTWEQHEPRAIGSRLFRNDVPVALVVGTNWTATNSPSGEYFYATTVDALGQESVPSNYATNL